MPRLAPLLAAAAAALASAAGASPVSSGPPSVTCETCQVMALMATRGMAELPPSHHGSRDIGAMDVLEGLCEYSAWGEYAGKAALPTGAMADACERVRDDVEELFEEELVRDGLNEADLRAKACLARGHCDALWGPGEDPDSRESPSERNAREGAAYREEYAARDGVRETVSGLLYRVLREGEAGGARPDVNDHVTVHYRGTLIDGTQFDASYDRGEPAQFGVTGVIPGWTEALMLMTAGAQYELVIPPELAYGPSGSGDEIGPDATLVFTVELLGIDQGAANHGEL